MTNDITAGKLNVHMTEYITKFRLGKLDSEFLFDGDDFKDNLVSYTRYVNVDDATLIKKFYYEGNLELYFRICIGNADGTSSVIPKYKSVSFNEAFQLSKVQVDFRHKTWFSSRKWVYTVDRQCFVPKWVNANIQLPKWDISSQSTVMNINVSEYDNEGEIETSISITNSFTTNFTTEGEIAADMPMGNAKAHGKIKVGYGQSNSDQTTQTVIVKEKTGSDDLGTDFLYYVNPVILSQSRVNAVSGYRVQEIDTGFVYMLVMPKYE